ncbi:hypothetical protein OG453_15135 [Streptomyces sp. NBC_01381]|uniref:effector-associated constant component EACC1 n=1 Tax=Streptomyces sp. NBC_01381 TaxID=2903845 RepID=UPI0022548A38|nr:hypothetical protein [Streptomyces sp. NBC_01381]MCX4667990.1 hypothetical protein [Streptomyces sp. NBC_01381]
MQNNLSLSGGLDALLVITPHSDLDDEHCERITRQLRSELMQLDVDAVRRAPSVVAAPDGAKPGDPFTLGAIIVSLSTSGALVAVIETARDWLQRQNQPHGLKITINNNSVELADATDEERSALVALLIRQTDNGS